jgi:hypothetical protein
MVVYTCVPILGRLRHEDHEFEARLGYTVIPYLKTTIKTASNEAQSESAGVVWGVCLCTCVYTNEFKAVIQEKVQK